ncbi:hypothetical protein F5878DRAFT_667331 [Lentinula raphanica]|uniref:Uncharacterized protein n=1 Tax=Lentinula raphanica TaxID=153919 RepID=A0AA38NW61_9AGAR|nr:hypothetical protein F5878DRAFT_667331 [Lentinula raphanica]
MSSFVSPVLPVVPFNSPVATDSFVSLDRLAAIAATDVASPGDLRRALLSLLNDNRLLGPKFDVECLPSGFVDGLASCITGYVSGYHDLTRVHQGELAQQLINSKEQQAILEQERDTVVRYMDSVIEDRDRLDAERRQLQADHLELLQRFEDVQSDRDALQEESHGLYAEFTRLENEEVRLETANTRLLETRDVLVSQNEKLFKDLMSVQESLSLAQGQNRMTDTLHELAQTKEELTRVCRDLALSRSTAESVQDSNSLHLSTLNRKDEQIGALHDMVRSLEQQLFQVRAASAIISQRHTDLVVAHNNTCCTLDATVAFARRMSSGLILLRSIDFVPFMAAIREDITILIRHCASADWNHSLELCQHLSQSLQTIKSITGEAFDDRNRRLELMDMDELFMFAEGVNDASHGRPRIPFLNLNFNRVDPDLPSTLQNTPGSNWSSLNAFVYPGHLLNDASSSAESASEVMTPPIESDFQSPPYCPQSPETIIDDDLQEEFLGDGDLMYPGLDD